MTRPVVLFLCTWNSARSQLAEALLKHRAGDRFDVHSAGLEPRGVHPLTIDVMEEIGISMQEHRSKSVSEYLGKLPVRYAITVCARAEQACPSTWPFSPQRLFWPFPDPAEPAFDEFQQIQQFRAARNAIAERIDAWLREEANAIAEGRVDR